MVDAAWVIADRQAPPSKMLDGHVAAPDDYLLQAIRLDVALAMALAVDAPGGTCSVWRRCRRSFGPPCS